MATNTTQIGAGKDFAVHLAAARRGCRESLGHLLNRSGVYLRSVIRARTGARRCAEATSLDHLQETYLRALRGFESFRGTTTPELHAWLRRILLNRLAEYEVEQLHRPRPVLLEGDPADLSTPLPFARQDAADPLRCALMRLAADHQEVIRLHYWENLPWNAVGKRLHRSADAARMQIVRGRQRPDRKSTR